MNALPLLLMANDMDEYAQHYTRNCNMKKIVLTWFLLSSILSILLVVRAPEYLPVGGNTADAIKTSSELQLLEQLISLDTMSKEALQNRYNELHKAYKHAVINSQIEGLPVAILYYMLIGINLINVLVVAAGFFVTRKPGFRQI